MGGGDGELDDWVLVTMADEGGAKKEKGRRLGRRVARKAVRDVLRKRRENGELDGILVRGNVTGCWLVRV